MTENAPVPQPSPAAPDRWLNAACILALVGLALTLAHLIVSSPLLFAVFMIFGQGALGLAMGIYAFVILRDLRSRKVL